MDYHFRITISYDANTLLKINEIFGEQCNIAIYQHEADDEVSRTHVHGICQGCTVKSPKTIRDGIKKAFVLEKSDYAVGEGVGKSPEYITKGRLDPVFYRGYTEEYISELKSKGYDTKKDKITVKDGKIVIERDKKEVKKTDIDMIKEVAARCVKNKTYEPREVAVEIVKTWKSNNKRGHSRLLEEWIDAVRYYAKEDDWIDQVVQRYNRKFS